MTEARMQESADYKPGTFCWVELGTSNSPQATQNIARTAGANLGLEAKVTGTAAALTLGTGTLTITLEYEVLVLV